MRTRALLVCLLLFVLVAPAGADAPAAHKGRWLTDEYGRVVILHGVNMVMKLPPYDPGSIGFDDDDAAFLASEGFNVVRLGIIYKALEPTRGTYDEAYLDRIATTVDVLGSHGVKVLLDFHQDMFNERFNGEGFPDWAVNDDGLPAQPDGGFPANYFVMPALWRAYDHLWANDNGLQDSYAAAWGHVAARFASNPAVLGYDTFNEPWAGTTWPTCLNPVGCPLWESMTLTPFYKKVFAQIRLADPSKMVFYETHPIYAGGADVHIDDTGDENAGFSFHSYCLGALVGQSQTLGPLACPLGADRPYVNADAQSSRTDDALLLSEFGATDDIATIQRDLVTADNHTVSWTYWTYAGGDPCCPRAAEGIILDPSKPPTPDNVKQPKLNALVRPYPRAIAGTPYVFSFETSFNYFSFYYETDTSITAPTEISIPARQYPTGYTVGIFGPAVVTSAPNAAVLTIENTGPGTVHVVVTP